MVSDYERIRDDNIKEYGEGTRHLAFLGRLYTDRTHFVFELLQNAEDAGATRVRFRLYANRLEVWHDGKLFDEEDVRGISGVGEGTKAEDLTQIGKFGIGFKSVYAYTSRPEVHCGDEHFCIENYVRPRKVSERTVGKPWTTLFSFPFKHPDIEPEIAYSEIGKRLQALSPRTLLFLHNITEISWDTVKGLSGVYSREMSSCGPARKVVVTSRDNLQNEEEAWIIFSRQLDVPKESGDVKVEVAFNVKRGKEEEKDEIAPIAESPLVVFFPTEKETHLGFLIQGPYRTTPSRDNIPKDDLWNKYLVEETGKLTVDSLVQLREMRLLTVSLLQALPINTDKFSVDGMFHPIYDYVRDALRNQPLLPAHNGNVIKAENAKLAITNDLRELLADEQLSVLYRHSDSLAWLSGNITIGKTPVLRNFLMRELGVEEVSWETFARRFGSAFIELQPDAWIAKLYGILDGHKALWRASDSKFTNRQGVLRNKPFIRLEDGSHVPPFDSNGTTNAYIGPLEETDFPVVKRDIVGDIQAQEFLKHLGLSEPDIVAEVIDNILPEYENGMADVKKPMQRHAANLQKILKAFQTDSRAKREILIKRLKETSFLLAINAGNSCPFGKRA